VKAVPKSAKFDSEDMLVSPNVAVEGGVLERKDVENVEVNPVRDLKNWSG